MNLPEMLTKIREWTLLGPMGPWLAPELAQHPVMGVDGGARFASHLTVWVGDGDSLAAEVRSDVTFKYPSEKASSDLALALALLAHEQAYKLHLWGFLGGRKDHELFNLGEALNWLEKKEQSQIHFYASTLSPVFTLFSAGSWGLQHQGPFSLGVLREGKIKLEGACRYPLSVATSIVPLSSLGLSNQADGAIALTSEVPVFIYYPEHL